METGGKNMSQTIGTQSIQFDQAPYILGSASIVGTKEGEGPLGNKLPWRLERQGLRKTIFVIFLEAIC